MLQATAGAARVLGLGCGTGRLLAQVNAPTRVGIDISRAMLQQARTHIAHLAVADAHQLPFADRSFDTIIAGKGVFRYLDGERAFAECARILVPGGRLAVHQYAARTWSVRALLRPRRTRPAASGIREIEHLDDLYRPARRAGLAVTGTWLWRSIRVAPYALAIPTWAPGHLWSHCVVTFKNDRNPLTARGLRNS